MIRNDELALHFSGHDGEFLKFDCRADLRRILCPTLVMAGDRDPITPITFSETIVANLPKHLIRFERFPILRLIRPTGPRQIHRHMMQREREQRHRQIIHRAARQFFGRRA